MEIESACAEGPVAIVPICGLEVAGVACSWHVPQPAAQVGKGWQARMQVTDFGDKVCIICYAADAVVQAALSTFQVLQHLQSTRILASVAAC